MKHLILLFLFFGSVSCSSNAQEQPVPTSSADTIPAQKITLLFAGDLMQHQAQIDAARTATGYDYTDYFKLIKEEIGKADIAIGNLEVTLGGKPYRGYPAFSAPDEYLTAIKDAGFNVLITANNHCLDRGKKGLERTILMLIPYKFRMPAPTPTARPVPRGIHSCWNRMASALSCSIIHMALTASRYLPPTSSIISIRILWPGTSKPPKH